MDFYNIPIGFGMALAANQPALAAYAAMLESEKHDILTRAQNVRSEQEMIQLVAELAGGKLQ